MDLKGFEDTVFAGRRRGGMVQRRRRLGASAATWLAVACPVKEDDRRRSGIECMLTSILIWRLGKKLR